jgi:uncharacterized protein (DUF2147 family)
VKFSAPVSARYALCLLVAMVAAAFGAQPAAAAPIALSSVIGPSAVGTWRTLDGTEVTVAPCAEGLCGTLSYIVIPKKNAADCRAMDHAAFASLMLDYGNPDKSLQSRPLLGMTMLTIAPTGDPNTYTARVYNPTDGSTNDIEVFIVNGGTTLRVGGGCVGSVCVVTQDWPKVADRPDAPDFTCEGGQ